MKVRFYLILMLLLGLLGTAQAQTNVIFGYVGDYTGQPPGTRYTITVKLLAPNPRWNGVTVTKVDTMPVSLNLTNGYFSVTNLLAGYYQWTISGVNGTTFNKWVYSTTTGRVPLGSLDNGDPDLIPPNPSTNYYTQAQVDALLAGIGSGSVPDNVVTNGQWSTILPEARIDGTTNSISAGLLSANDLAGNGNGYIQLTEDMVAQAGAKYIGDGSGLTNLSLTATTNNLKAWVASESYQAPTPLEDADGVIYSASVIWPDGSSGTFTCTKTNPVWHVPDAYTITHAGTGWTIVQSAVTRSPSGRATNAPALTIQ